MSKSPEVFLDHFARLGVFSKVLQISSGGDEEEDNLLSAMEEKPATLAVAAALMSTPVASAVSDVKDDKVRLKEWSTVHYMGDKGAPQIIAP